MIIYPAVNYHYTKKHRYICDGVAITIIRNINYCFISNGKWKIEKSGDDLLFIVRENFSITKITKFP